jgi:hypothetical protein
MIYRLSESLYLEIKQLSFFPFHELNVQPAFKRIRKGSKAADLSSKTCLGRGFIVFTENDVEEGISCKGSIFPGISRWLYVL